MARVAVVVLMSAALAVAARPAAGGLIAMSRCDQTACDSADTDCAASTALDCSAFSGGPAGSASDEDVVLASRLLLGLLVAGLCFVPASLIRSRSQRAGCELPVQLDSVRKRRNRMVRQV